jgi:hypothetical protein
VTVDGTGLSPTTDPERGEPRDEVSEGAGSSDLADCTRSSSFCIFPIKPRIWYKDPDLGNPDVRGAFILVMLVREATEGVERLAVLKARDEARE